MRFLTILAFLLVVNDSCFAKQSSFIYRIKKTNIVEEEDLKKSRDFILSLNYQINSVSGESKESSYQELQKIVKENIDIQKIAKLVMGKHWQLVSEDRKRAFIEEYGVYLERLYVNYLYKFKGNKVDIIGNQHLGNNFYLVSTRLSNNGDFININYKLKKSNDSFYIIDVAINGISINVTQRLKFEQKIQENGLEDIISTLKQSNSNSNF